MRGLLLVVLLVGLVSSSIVAMVANGNAVRAAENFELVEMKLQNGWGGVHKSFGQGECPSEACYAVVVIEGGHVVEVRELYLS